MPSGVRAQLVTTFNPGMPPARETELGHALAQWRGLDDAERAAAMLIVQDETEKRRVYTGDAIMALDARR